MCTPEQRAIPARRTLVSQRTEGLTDADLIGAVTATYGLPLAPTAASRKARVSEPSEDGEQVTVIARWENAESSVTLLRKRYPTPVSLVVLSKRLSDLARTAAAEGIRLDSLEAPQREAERLQRQADAARATDEKARSANKVTFKP